jgi:hypothetical protein
MTAPPVWASRTNSCSLGVATRARARHACAPFVTIGSAERNTPIPTQVRIYTINRGMLDSWIQIFNEKIVPTSAKFGVQVVGAWVNRAQNEFIWVRTYATDETLKTYEQSAERATYTGQTGPHIAKTEVRTVEDGLRPAS